jgi:hypothetical protein
VKLASNAEIVAITRALLALSIAVRQIGQAVEELGKAKREGTISHVAEGMAALSARAADESLEHIQKLLALIDKGHG